MPRLLDPNKLQAREIRFIEEYLRDPIHPREAYIRAGYAAKNARRLAWGILQRPRVKAEIQRRQELVMQDAMVDAKWIVEKLIAMVEDPNTNDHARAKALDQLAKLKGMYVEKLEVGRAGEFSKLSDEELEVEIQRLELVRPELPASTTGNVHTSDVHQGPETPSASVYTQDIQPAPQPLAAANRSMD